jgi:hypothetical protein
MELRGFGAPAAPGPARGHCSAGLNARFKIYNFILYNRYNFFKVIEMTRRLRIL